MLSPFYRGGNGGLQRLSILPKVIQGQHLDSRSGDVDPEASASDLWARQYQKELGTPGFESPQCRAEMPQDLSQHTE